jgi:hypothetical protein
MPFPNRKIRQLILESPNGSRIVLDADEATITFYGKNGNVIAVQDAALEAFGDSIYVHQVFDSTGALVAQFGGLVIKVVGTDGSANLSAGSSGDDNSLPRLELTLPSQTTSAIVQAADVADNGGTLTIRSPTFSTHDFAEIEMLSETDVAPTRINVTASLLDVTGNVEAANIFATDVNAADDVIATGDVTSGGASLGDPPGALLRQIVAQGCTNAAFTGLTFTQEDYDNVNGHSNVTNNTRYTCQVAGRYQLSGKVSFVTNTNGRRITLWRLNGTTTVPGSQISRAVGAGADEKSFDCAVITTVLAVGDYVEMMVYQDSGTNPLNTAVGDTGTQSYMEIRRVGAA